ncbi:transcriptional regulator, TetR family [Methanococcus maripaludis C5]|uniref:Transcriptional regulator, TetR family n=1 Tax=Methanococcus maripaludis (strain C5 / ATCC BAA-1333) TaxID=402880 RepID=A4FYW8_METM5|nr:TetR/AcrR family transcriptional regulator [Methanococcus maripaludis]ABO35402.1 transcriptional regulator, TetR family [Methanococcus maripaludis C5]
MTTRNLILEKSRELFFKKGYIETSLSEIAKECNISKGGLYYYFERKEDLYIETITSILEENGKAVLSCIEKESCFENAIFEFIEQAILIRNRYFSKYGKGEEKTVYFGPFSDAIKKFPKIWEFNNNIYENAIDKLVNRIILAQEMGEVKKELDPHTLAIHFCSIFEGLPLVSYYTNKKFDDKARMVIGSFWELIKN